MGVRQGNDPNHVVPNNDSHIGLLYDRAPYHEKLVPPFSVSSAPGHFEVQEKQQLQDADGENDALTQAKWKAPIQSGKQIHRMGVLQEQLF